jgi:hypothetical protein
MTLRSIEGRIVPHGSPRKRSACGDTIDPQRSCAILIEDGMSPIAARLLTSGAPRAFAFAAALLAWRDVWGVLDRAELDQAAAWRMRGRG